MWIVALQAIGRSKWLVVMCFLETGIFDVVAIEAQRWCALRQVKLVFGGEIGAGFVRRMAGIAPHIECGMAAALLRTVRPLAVAAKAQIVFLFS